MCAGCPGGRAVSPGTAYLNLNRMKLAVLAELRRTVGRRAAITVFGDHWVLSSRTGSQQLFPDVETLAGALTGKHGIVDLEQILESMTDQAAQPLSPRQFVQALLRGGGDE
jgi:hypothetical protein